MPSRAPTAILRIVLLFVVYAGAVVWLTWPVASDPFQQQACPNPACAFDARYSAWVLAWESHALTTPGVRLADANIFYPTQDALYYGPAGFGALPYFLPTFLLTGHAGLALNVLLLLGATLSALSLHLVVRRWTGLDSAGVVAGGTLLVQPWYLQGFVAVTPHLAPLAFFPWIVLLASRRHLSRRALLLLGALMVGQSLTDLVYVAGAVLAPVGVLGLYRLARRQSRLDGLVLLGVVAASAACLVPLLAAYARVRADNPRLNRQTPWKITLLPTVLDHLIWRNPFPTTIPPAALVLIGIGLLLAGWRLYARRALARDDGWRHGLLWTVVGVAISVTPLAIWFGRFVRLPHALLNRYTPLYSIIRVPQRLGVAALIGSCLLAGIALAEVLGALDGRVAGRSARRALHVALAGAMLVALYLVPVKGANAPAARYRTVALPTIAPTVAAALRATSGPVVALPIHYGPESRPSQYLNATFMYLSTSHWRPLVNGYSSYWPLGFPQRAARAARLPDPDAVRSLLKLGVRTYWVDLRLYAPGERGRWADVRRGNIPGLTVRARENFQMVIDVDPDAFGGARTTPAS